jgi:hypothetical protein
MEQNKANNTNTTDNKAANKGQARVKPEFVKAPPTKAELEKAAAEVKAETTTTATTPAPAVNPLAEIIAQVATTAPAASAPVPTKTTTARVIKEEHVRVVLLLLQRTKEQPAFRVNLDKATRRVCRRLVKNGVALNGKNAEGFAGFWINPAADLALIQQYVDIAKAKSLKPVREVPGAGRDDKE